MDDLDDMDEKVIREIFMDEGIIKKKDGSKTEFDVILGLDTSSEVEYYKLGGILQYVINKLGN